MLKPDQHDAVLMSDIDGEQPACLADAGDDLGTAIGDDQAGDVARAEDLVKIAPCLDGAEAETDEGAQT